MSSPSLLPFFECNWLPPRTLRLPMFVSVNIPQLRHSQVGAAGGAAGAGGVGPDTGGAGAVPAGSGGAARPRPYFVQLLEQVLGLPPSTGSAPSLECPPPVQSQSLLQPASPLTTLAALGFAPSTADPSLFLPTNTTLPPFYILMYVDDLVFATAGLAHVKSARRTITWTQSHMVQQVLQRFNLKYSSPRATPLSTRHSLSALPSDESVEPSGQYPELVGCLIYLMTCTRPDLAYPLSILARYVAPGRHRPGHMDTAKRVLRYLCSTSGMGLVLGGRARVVLTGQADASLVDNLATQRSSQGYTFSLGSGFVSWWSTRSSSVLSSNCEAEIYAVAMAAQELRWLTYLLTDLGEAPRSPPVVYVDNKAMLALCQEHRLEHRMKHIALRYFLARELQQRGQLRLTYVATLANTAYIFTKALLPCDHQCFCTMLGVDRVEGAARPDLRCRNVNAGEGLVRIAPARLRAGATSPRQDARPLCEVGDCGNHLPGADQVLEDALAATRIVTSIHKRIEPAAEPEVVDTLVVADEDSGGGIP
ncbi:unnamed protein product [Closterium sp. NIES-54]